MASPRRRQANIAEPEVLSSYNATATRSELSDELNFNNWTFRVQHANICHTADLIRLARSIEATLKQDLSQCTDDDTVTIDSHKLRLPPMLFLQDIISFSHNPSKVDIQWGAEDALTTWASQHTDQYKACVPLRIVQVPHASEWSKRSLGPHVSAGQASLQSIQSNANSGLGANISASVVVSHDALVSNRLWEWTFSSEYVCSIVDDNHDASIIAARALNQETSKFHSTSQEANQSERKIPSYRRKVSNDSRSDSAPRWRWERAAVSGLDLEMLKTTDVPILFFDESILYQDDLEDCGEVVNEVKVRVMPHCWFVLNRMLMRVDGSIVRVRETRLFHKFISDECATSSASSCDSVNDTAVQIDDQCRTREATVHVVVTWRELNMLPDVEASSLPLPPAPDSRGGVPAKSSAWGVLRPQQLRNPAWIAEKVPEVNARDDVHQFYTLHIPY